MHFGDGFRIERKSGHGNNARGILVGVKCANCGTLPDEELRLDLVGALFPTQDSTRAKKQVAAKGEPPELSSLQMMVNKRWEDICEKHHPQSWLESKISGHEVDMATVSTSAATRTLLGTGLNMHGYGTQYGDTVW